MRHVADMNVNIGRKRALDFGCGVGRLTQALANHFDETYGIDVAASMIDQAIQYNRHGAKCTYLVNNEDNLAAFPDDSFDLVFSYIVLQHMRPEYSKGYIKEFLRVLAPGGLIAFQIPSELAPAPLRHSSESKIENELPAERLTAQ